jgi:predicted DNA-binding antitoxin AbrB/MazE fold protein
MATTIEATFDGQVFRPAEPVSLPPNTTVRITIEPIPVKPASFLRTARSLNLEGPADWASRLDDYLYGEGEAGAG